MTKQKVWQLYPNKAVWMGSGAQSLGGTGRESTQRCCFGPCSEGEHGELGKMGSVQNSTRLSCERISDDFVDWSDRNDVTFNSAACKAVSSFACMDQQEFPV